MKTIRIFISSPGDVAEERDKARLVIEQLQKFYGSQLRLVPVLWEDLPLQVDSSFQDGIELVLSDEQGVDVAVFVLWSRLGTPQGGASRRADGTPYRSGTEREFDMMLQAREQSGGKKPHILAYVRQDDSSFGHSLEGKPTDELEKMIYQKKLVEGFVEETFQDTESGANLRAFHIYDQPVSFAQRLRVHLRGVLDTLAGADAVLARWDQEPYRGLEVFDVEHAPIFFGREEEVCDVEQLLARRAEEEGCGSVVIVGASGSGKSSLARAGVAASLMEQNLDESIKQWRCGILLPGACQGDLIKGLVEALATEVALPELHQGDAALSDVAEGLASAPEQTVKLAVKPAFARAGEEKGGAVRLLLVIDQFEEAFSDRRIDEEQREGFLEAVEELVRSGLVRVLFTLRSDFYSVAQKSEAFLRLKGTSGQYDLLAPGTSALARMISEPARLSGASFERDERTGRSLDQRILEAAAAQPEALPLLQYTLRELYEQRDGQGRLTFAAYEEMGGVEGALGTRAEAVFCSLPDEVQSAFGEVMHQLVTVDTQSEANLRQRAWRDEVARTPTAERFVERLVEERFLITGVEGERARVTIAHEALLRSWDRLAEWIAANREHLRLRARMMQSHARWESSGRDASLLLPVGLPLEEGRDLRCNASQLLGEDLIGYIETSVYHAEAREKRKRRVRSVVVGAMACLALIAAGAGIFGLIKEREARGNARTATEKQKEAEEQRRIALIQKNVAEEQEKIAVDQKKEAEIARTQAEEERKKVVQANAEMDELLLTASWADHEAALRAIEEGNHAEGLANFARALTLYPENSAAAVGSASIGFGMPRWATRSVSVFNEPNSDLKFGPTIVFSPNIRWFAEFYEFDSNKVRVIETATGKEISRVEFEGPVNSVNFSPDGCWFAVGSKDNTARVIESATGKEVSRFMFEYGVTSVIFSPNGRWYAAGSIDSTVRVIEAVSGREVSRVEFEYGLPSVSFSPDGRWFAVSSKGDPARVIESATGREVSRIVPQSTADWVSFSPDGRWFACGKRHGATRVIEAATGKEVSRVEFENPVTSVSFSPDGRWFAARVEDYTARVIEVATGKEVSRVDFDEWVNSVSFSPDGRWFAAGSDDHTVRVIEAVTGREVSRIECGSPVNSVLFSTDGRWLAAGTLGTVRVIEAVTGMVVSRVEFEEGVDSVSFSPDGRRFVANFNVQGMGVTSQFTTRVIEVATGKEISSAEYEGEVNSVSFSPDGRWFVAGSSDNTVRVIEVVTGKEISRVEFEGEVNSVSFSPNGHWFAAGSSDDTARVIEAATGREVSRVEFQDEVSSVCFSPEGQWLAVGSGDNTEVIEAATGKEVSRVAFEGWVNSVCFSPNGRWLAINNRDKISRVIEVETGEEVSRVWDEMSIESVIFSPDSRWFATGSQDNTARVIESATGKEVSRVEFDDYVRSMRFSPDGRWLAVGSHDRTARVIEAATGKEVSRVEFEHYVSSVRFSPDGRWVTASSYDTVELIDARWLALPLVPDQKNLIGWQSALRLRSGLEFDEFGKLRPLNSKQWVGISESLLKYRTHLPENSAGQLPWEESILRWNFSLPELRTTSPWSEERFAHRVGRELMATPNSVTISEITSQAPWHPLSPISLARLEDDESDPNGRRRAYLAGLTLRRLRDADEEVYGRDRLAQYTTVAERWMRELEQETEFDLSMSFSENWFNEDQGNPNTMESADDRDSPNNPTENPEKASTNE